MVDGASNGVHRTVDYITDAYGQVLFRQETDYSVAMAQRTFFYLNGRSVGDVGNDQLDSRVDYAQALGSGPQRCGLGRGCDACRHSGDGDRGGQRRLRHQLPGL
ncbi:MAG: hypothetical protein WDN06_17395 [Asticcacaulis sp.]